MSQHNGPLRHSSAGLESAQRSASGSRRSRAGLVSIVIALALVAGFQPYGDAAKGAGSWSDTPPLHAARSHQTATALTDGTVLLAGGEATAGTSTTYLASSEMYDPRSNSWVPAGSLQDARSNATATRLLDGRVLVVGGANASGYLASTEIFSPQIRAWSSGPVLHFARSSHTATLLPDGRVLVTGGYGTTGILNSAELFDPASNSWSDTGSLQMPRGLHTATALADGTVLVSGGFSTNGPTASVELFDPVSATWKRRAPMVRARDGQSATLLPDGRVLVAGGYDGTGSSSATTEIFDPAKPFSWIPAAPMQTPRGSHSATLLASGHVLIAGGSNSAAGVEHVQASAELFDASTGLWSPAGSLTDNRLAHTATLLPSGAVLVAGGTSTLGTLSSAELFTGEQSLSPTPGTVTPTPTSTAVPFLTDTATLMPPTASSTPVLSSPTETATPTAIPATLTETPTTVPAPRISFLALRAEKNVNSPDWNLSRPPVGVAAGGDRLTVSTYVRIKNVPPGARVAIATNILRGNIVVHRSGMTATVTGPGTYAVWHHFNFEPQASGTYTCSSVVSVDTVRRAASTSFTIAATPPAAPPSFTFDRLRTLDRGGRSLSTFAPNQQVTLAADWTVRNVSSSATMTVKEGLQYPVNGGWQALGSPLQLAFATGNGPQSYRFSFQSPGTFGSLRLVLDLVLGTGSRQRSVIIHIKR